MGFRWARKPASPWARPQRSKHFWRIKKSIAVTLNTVYQPWSGSRLGAARQIDKYPIHWLSLILSIQGRVWLPAIYTYSLLEIVVSRNSRWLCKEVQHDPSAWICSGNLGKQRLHWFRSWLNVVSRQWKNFAIDQLGIALKPINDQLIESRQLSYAQDNFYCHDD